MKKIFSINKIVSVCFASLLLISCEESKNSNTESILDRGISNVSIPAYEIGENGLKEISELVLNGSSSNISSNVKEELKNLPSVNDAKNIIFMFFDGLTEDLIEETESEYKDSPKYGELLLNDLPLKLTFTSDKIDDNTSESNIIGDYLFDECHRYGSYVAQGCCINSVFRQFQNSKPLSSTETTLVYSLFNGGSRPIFIIAKDTESGEAISQTSPESSYYTNSFYKAEVKRVTNFKDAVSCYQNDQVLINAIPGDGEHGDKYVNPRGVYTIYPSDTKEYPSPIQSMAYTLAYMADKSDLDGFFTVFYDDAAGEDKHAELKNFDEAVIAASKFVLENPDTVLVVTSATLDGSQIPAYIFGNVPESAKQETRLINFVKAIIK